MYVPFEALPPTARVWVYQTNRPINDVERLYITDYLKQATDQWAAHGVPMKTSFEVMHGRFVLIAADETHTAASGCSIDASTHWFQQLGQQLGIDFFDRSVLYLTPDDKVQTANPFAIKKAVESGEIGPQTPVFTPQVATVADLQTWPVPAASVVQYRRYFSSNPTNA